MCVPTYSSRSDFEKLVFQGGGGQRGKRSKKGEPFFNKKEKKAQGGLNSLEEGYKTYLLSHCATVPVLHDVAYF